MSALPKIEINCPAIPSPDFYIKIDGKKIKGVIGFKIEQHIDNKRVPVIIIELLAKEIKGKIKGHTCKIIKEK